MGADIAMLGNQYAPAFPGDDEFVWCLCYGEGCGLPFQYWGTFGYVVEGDADVPFKIAAGPCTHCGAVGLPMELHRHSQDGVTTTSSSKERRDEWFKLLVGDLRDGVIAPEQVVERLRQGGGPFSRLADWVEERPAATAAIVGVLGILATLLGPQLEAGDGGHVDEQEINQIIDNVLDHYDEMQRNDRRWLRRQDGSQAGQNNVSEHRHRD